MEFKDLKIHELKLSPGEELIFSVERSALIVVDSEDNLVREILKVELDLYSADFSDGASL
jgi:hypothetical protein